MPRSLHLAAAKAGLLGVSFPEEVGGQGGSLLDSVAMQEAFFEAGGSSGLAAALFTGGIALPHMAAHGTPDQVDAFVRPTLAGREDRRRSRSPSRAAAPTSRAITHHRRPRRRLLRRQRREDLHHQRRPRRLRHHGRAHRRPGPRRVSACSSSRRARPASPSTGRCRRWAGTARTPPSCPSSTRACPVANLVGAENSGFALIAEQFVVERIALAVHAYGIAARSLALTASYCRERETFGKPLIANQVVRHKLVEMHRQVEVARTYTRAVAARHDAGRGRHRRGLPGQADRRRGVRPRRRPGRAAARRHRLHARDRGGAALPRRPDPRHRRRSDRGAHRPVRTTAGIHAMMRSLGGEVSLHIDAPPEEVWALVSDVTRIGEFCPRRSRRAGPAARPAPRSGASFKGHVKRNGVGPTYWSPCQVTDVRAERGLRVRRRHRRRDPEQLGLPDGARAARARRSPSTSGSSRRCPCASTGWRSAGCAAAPTSAACARRSSG